MPAVSGQSMEVPGMNAARLPVPRAADQTLTPGAETSGFGAESGLRGPPDGKLAASLYPGWVTLAEARDTMPPSAARSAAVCAERWRTPRKGIVTLCCSPVSGFCVIGPSKGGKAPELLIITTAASPASSPKTARATRAHVPRVVTTTIPAVPAYSALLQPSDTDPSALRPTLPLDVPLGSAAPLASIACTGLCAAPPELVRLRGAPGRVGVLPSTAATESTPLAGLGEPPT